MKKALLVLALFFAVLGVSAWQAWDRYQQFLVTPLNISGDSQVFLLERGTTGADIVNHLVLLDLTRPGWEWRLLMRLHSDVYRAGEYNLQAGTTPPEFLKILTRGEVMQYRVTLVEGWNFRQFAGVLADNPVLHHTYNLAEPNSWEAVCRDLGIEHPEGWFLPETYQFTRGDEDRDILLRAHEAMQQALQEAWNARDEDLTIASPYELLILASIIEKETSLDEERTQVAGVFVRRLNRGMRLQTDPTVIYGLGETFDGDIRKRDLKTDTAYNTYTRHGLPPTPIAMPGRNSLMAAARPAPGDALFFVANGLGGHTFSATLEAHQEAVRKLIERKK